MSKTIISTALNETNHEFIYFKWYNLCIIESKNVKIHIKQILRQKEEKL